MNELQSYLAAFSSAVSEGLELYQRNVDRRGLRELIWHAGEILKILEEEIVERSDTVSSRRHEILAQMHARLESLKRHTAPPLTH